MNLCPLRSLSLHYINPVQFNAAITNQLSTPGDLSACLITSRIAFNVSTNLSSVVVVVVVQLRVETEDHTL